MKLTAIKFLIIFLLFPFVSAIDFNFTSPLEVNQNDIFKVSISSNSTSDNYDVKIYVNDDSKEFCEIYNGTEWRSPFYYLVSFYPQIKEYDMKSYFSGDTTICVKLRKTGTSTSSQVCNPIKINPSEVQNSSQSSSQSDEENSESSIEEKSETIANNVSSQSNQDSPSQSSSQSYQIKSESNNDKIILNSKIEESSFMTKEQKTRLIMIYVFSFLCIIIIILLSLKKL